MTRLQIVAWAISILSPFVSLATFRQPGLARGFAFGAPLAVAAWGALIWLAAAFGCLVAFLTFSLALASWLAVFYLVAQFGGP